MTAQSHPSKPITWLLTGAMVLAVIIFPTSVSAANSSPWWQVQSIDTMKYSRDMSRELLNNHTKLSSLPRQHMKQIAETGATHVAIATPYDEEFVPVLTAWVTSAREAGLKVWFRGNLSGWEGWFEYPPISRAEHTQGVVAFINAHPDLFEDGDLFSSCPECENGGPGDPRLNQDTAGHRQFLIAESKAVNQAFKHQRKHIISDIHSMNGDVATLIMDPKTTNELGGIITVDHYVKTPAELADDLLAYATKSQGQVMLGEFGAPIPDIHGNMSPAEQALWLDEVLGLLAPQPNLLGVNYWVNMGGSTALWEEDGQPTLAVAVLSSYFKPKTATGRLLTNNRQPVANATLTSSEKVTETDANGYFALPYRQTEGNVIIRAVGYDEKIMPLSELIATSPTIDLSKTGQSHRWQIFLNWLAQLWKELAAQ